jgi:alpha-L-fucosidase
MRFFGLVVALVVLLCYCVASQARYTPDWSSLDARPLPDWYDEGKFGIFIHWGVFSVPSYCCGGLLGEWYWWGLDGMKEPCLVDWHTKTYGPNFKYQDFANSFTADLFDPNEWASLFAKSGAKYVVLTSKHHEGFCNWPSAQSWNWNSATIGPHSDNVGRLTQAVRSQTDLHMGLYHSLFEWFHPLYLQDKANGGKTQYYVDQILLPQLHDIVNTYKPEVIWSDGDWEMPDSYWKSKEFLAWLYNDSPVKDTIVVNDRWGSNDACHHGGFWTCSDHYNPGHLVPHKWENAFTIDTRSWGYARNSNISDYRTIEDLLYQLASTVSCGGNVLLNVGPTADGRINPVFQERLLQMGEWLKTNGEAIYKTKPWRVQNDTATGDIWYTLRPDTGAVYAILLTWPKDGIVSLQSPVATPKTTVQLLGFPANLPFNTTRGAMNVLLPHLTPSQYPSRYAWVLRLLNVK